MKALLLSFLALAISVQERPSFQKLTAELRLSEQIPPLYKNRKSAAASVLSKNQSLLRKWEKWIDDSAPFARGEIENEQTLNGVISLIQLELMKARAAASANEIEKTQKTFTRVFNFAADLAYEESSLAGLRLAHRVRSLALDEIEALERQNPKWVAENRWLKWVETLRVPWPIDRVVLAESKKVLGQRDMILAERVMRSLQKNTYDTTENLIAKVAGGSKNLNFLVPMWRQSDIQMMKTEIQRLTSVRVRMAMGIYSKATGMEAEKIEDLVRAKLLASVPVNYETGQSMTLSDAVLK